MNSLMSAQFLSRLTEQLVSSIEHFLETEHRGIIDVEAQVSIVVVIHGLRTDISPTSIPRSLKKQHGNLSTKLTNLTTVCRRRLNEMPKKIMARISFDLPFPTVLKHELCEPAGPRITLFLR